MNEIMKIEKAITMDSREIAELTGKRHADVIRDIEAQLSKVGDERKFASVYMGGNGEPRKCYKLPYRETMILVSGYSVELRAKVIDRWMELEAKEKSTAKIPQSFAEALQLAADQAREIEEKEKRIERLVHNNTTYTTSELAKELNMKSAQELNEHLHGMGIIFKDARGVWQLYSEYAGRGFQNIKQKEINGAARYYAEWTGIGREWVLGLFHG